MSDLKVSARSLAHLLAQLVFIALGALLSSETLAQIPAAAGAITTQTNPGTSAQSQLLLGLKSYNDSARFGYANDDASGLNRGQVLNGKQELFAGYRFANGWGGFAQFTEYRRQYNNSEMNAWVHGDPSLSLIHPALYDDGTFKVSGLFRAYLQYTNRTKAQNTKQFAYYSTQAYVLPGGAEIANFVNPRWFVSDHYAAADTNFYIEDRTVLTKKLNSWARVGIAQWTQLEQHSETATGYCTEIIPQFDYMFSPTTYLGPRISLPISSVNSVYDGPRNATTNEARAQLYFQTSL